VSGRFIFASFLGGALVIALLFIFVWEMRSGLFALSAALAGALLSWLIARSKPSEPTSTAAETPSRATTTQLPGDLKNSEMVSPGALLDATLESMREGMLLIDSDMRIVASNRAAREIFTQLEGRLESRLLSEVTRNPSIHSAFRAALETRARTEVKVEMQGMERRTFDLRVAPLRKGVGRSVEARGALGVFFDITRLERLERVRQEFLSNVSHELRTPLTAIIAFVETLEEGAIDDRENNRRFLSVIRKSASRMHTLIDDILELSAIEAGMVQVEPQHVRLHSIIEDVWTSLASRSTAHHVSLRNLVAPGVLVYAEGRRLEQMLTNLMDNAIKFSREDGTVTVSHARSGARDRITVTDTGEGISNEHIERIFERFYRIDRARSRELGGTGLGLAIVKHLARAHGGEATVQSTLASGSSFTIELPLAEMSESEDEGRESLPSTLAQSVSTPTLPD
jgi:two-component system phosphate regulon sensor histidine kinase PhoR